MNGPKVVAGNWKMNHGPGAARRFARELTLEEGGEREPELLLFPPSLSLAALREALAERSGELPSIGLGVQNIHWEDSGAYTGEVAAAMVAEAGASHVLVGHSERRHLFGETDEEVARKVTAAVGAELVPVVCVGETLEERRAGRVDEVIVRQLERALGIGSDPAPGGEGPAAGLRRPDGTPAFLLAYEPVWAIGTGETATPDDASAAHRTLRGALERAWGEEPARRTRVLYGGSVKPENAEDLLGAPHVDGVLVGGASLDPEAFAAIAASA